MSKRREEDLLTVESTTTVSKRTLSPKARKVLFAVIAIAVVVIVATAVFVGYFCGWYGGILGAHRYVRKYYNIAEIASEQLSVHFLRSGNGYTGDCVYIKAGETDVLIDAGTRRASALSIAEYVNRYCKDGILEYVVVTHADIDHISGFVGTKTARGIFERFQCNNIIQFVRTNKNTDTFTEYCKARDKEIEQGANCYTALQCYNNENGAKRVYELAPNITMEILYQEYYEKYSERENNYCVCVMINQGDNHYLFTGDLELAGETSLVEHNDLPEVVLYKGAHHGSITSSNYVLLDAIRPQYVCVCCNAGSAEYAQRSENTFPSQQFIDRVARYTDNVFVTELAIIRQDQWGNKINADCRPLNGDIVFACSDGKVKMYFSESDVKLKDTDWFRENRITPEQWSTSQ